MEHCTDHLCSPNGQPNGRGIVSVVLVTKDRCEDLVQCVESCYSQFYRPLEVLVFDSSSTDETAEALRSRFPDVRYFRNKVNEGYIVRRNMGFQMAQGELVISLDDDAFFSSRNTIDRVVEMFLEFPRAAVVALPFVERRALTKAALMQCGLSLQPLRSFAGCAYAVNRRRVLEVGGYRELLVHRGEERDLSIRLMDQGLDIIYGDTEPIVHLCSPAQDKNLARHTFNFLGTRNTFLFSLLNAPNPFMLARLAVDSVQLFLHRFNLRTIPIRVSIISASLLACFTFWRHRRPVRLSTYRRYRSLPSHGPIAGVDSSDIQARPTTECEKT